MPSFFTTPASQRKRKREGVTAAPSSKKRNTNIELISKAQKQKPSKAKRDESISGSESEAGDGHDRSDNDGQEVSTDSEDEDETGAERRLRLAERYLESIKNEVNETGFDAEDIDRDLIADRLQQDVAETKGQLYRRIASSLDFSAASRTCFRSNTNTTTSIAICTPYVYTVSKDITLTKWELADVSPYSPLPSKIRNPSKKPPQRPPPPRRRPRKLISTKGNLKRTGDLSSNHHTASILSVAASSSGKYVVTGGADKRLIVWSAADLAPLRVFTQHRDAVTSLAFRRNTNQLYSGSKDRTIKTWSLDELAYVETLFGHQDEVVDVAALAQERCISVGARDRTARLWKVVEETQLVFRGGGGGANRDKKIISNTSSNPPPIRLFAEGSIDRVTLIDEETFVTGSDNGSLSLWTLHKKKPIFTLPLAHGLDPPLTPEEISSEQSPDPNFISEPQARWITALTTVPYSDLILSGSWDGWVRLWRVSEDKKRIEKVGVLGRERGRKDVPGDAAGEENGDEGEGANEQGMVKGVINDLAVVERGERGQDGVCVVVARGTEHRLGRWKIIKGAGNGAMVFEVPKLRAENRVGPSSSNRR